MKICDELTVAEDKHVALFTEASCLSALKGEDKVDNTLRLATDSTTYLQHLPFVENFHGINFVSRHHSNDTNDAEGSASDYFEDLKVFASKAELLDAVHSIFN